MAKVSEIRESAIFRGSRYKLMIVSSPVWKKAYVIGRSLTCKNILSYGILFESFILERFH